MALRLLLLPAAATERGAGGKAAAVGGQLVGAKPGQPHGLGVDPHVRARGSSDIGHSTRITRSGIFIPPMNARSAAARSEG